MSEKIKAFCCWSGGKESALSLYRTKKLGFNISCLVNMVTLDGNYSRTHGIRSYWLKLQSELIEIPLIQRRTNWQSYEGEFKKVMSDLRDKGVNTGIFGDIDLQEHRDWVERVCRESEIRSIFPLWKNQREELLKEFIQAGFKTIIVATQSSFLDQEWLGREINNEFIDDLKTISNIDLCGEKGEFHTFVYYGPIFSRPIDFIRAGKIKKDDHWFLEILPKPQKNL